MSYREHMKAALFRAKECAKSLRRAADAIGCDIDAPLQEGLIEPPSPGDIPDSGFIEPTLFDDEIDDNPQGKRAAYLRLIKSAAAW
jgi:hypothetical protein